jgi:DMSO/TMAO reductase YedYZ molybdopterin-dependent catalytic subunit
VEPPNQHYVKKFIYYAALGVPRVDLSRWRLFVTGLVEKPLELRYEDLERMVDTDYVRDFHCVTGWSVKGVRWEGVKIRKLAEMAKAKPNARWVVFVSLDGYTSVVPAEDALHEDSIIALRINGRRLELKEGFPARPIIPHLYAWKSAKWLTALEFREDYVDGFWEERGYHERGNAFLEERFKGQGMTHQGMARRPMLDK